MKLFNCKELKVSTKDAMKCACKDMHTHQPQLNLTERLIFKRTEYENNDKFDHPFTIDELMLSDH